MEPIGFTCTRTELINRVNRIRTAVGPKISKKARREAILEIRVQPQYITLSVPFAGEKLYCATKGYGIFSLSLEYFYQLLYTHSDEVFSPVFRDGQMFIENTITSEAPLRAVHKPTVRKSGFQLPLRYNELVILKLRNEILDNQNEIPNAKILIENAEAKLLTDLDKAYNILQFYGVEYDEIKAIVQKYIQ